MNICFVSSDFSASVFPLVAWSYVPSGAIPPPLSFLCLGGFDSPPRTRSFWLSISKSICHSDYLRDMLGTQAKSKEPMLGCLLSWMRKKCLLSAQLAKVLECKPRDSMSYAMHGEKSNMKKKTYKRWRDDWQELSNSPKQEGNLGGGNGSLGSAIGALNKWSLKPEELENVPVTVIKSICHEWNMISSENCSQVQVGRAESDSWLTLFASLKKTMSQQGIEGKAWERSEMPDLTPPLQIPETGDRLSSQLDYLLVSTSI